MQICTGNSKQNLHCIELIIKRGERELMKIKSWYHAKNNPRKSNSQELKLKSVSLFDKKDAIIKIRVRQLKEGKIPTRECHTWLKKVEEIEKKVDDLLKSEAQDGTRMDSVMTEIDECLDKSPKMNDAVDDAMIGRAKRMNGHSKVGGSEYRTVEVGKTQKIQRTSVHSNAAARESSLGSKKSTLGNGIVQQDNGEEMISALLAAVSEPAKTYRMEKAGKIISVQNDGTSAFHQAGGGSPEKLGPEALRLEKSTSSNLLSQPSSMAHSESDGIETSRGIVSLERAETRSNLEEKSDITLSEVNKVSNTNELKDSETERFIPETENFTSEAGGKEPIRTREEQNEYCNPERNIPVQLEAKGKLALDVEAGMTLKKPDAKVVRRAMPTSPKESLVASTVAPSERSGNEGENVIMYTSSVLEEKNSNGSSEIKEISPTRDMNLLNMERSVPEQQSFLPDPGGITHKSENGSSKPGNKRVNQTKPNLLVNLKNWLFSRSSSRSKTVQEAQNLDLSRKRDISFPQAEEEKRISCMVQKIIECMQDDKYRRIGIYGEGGIGKTTVLKALSCSPEVKDKFDLLIRVTVSRYWSREKIQLEIARQIDINVEGLKSVDERASKLVQKLQSMKCLLLLDDVWDRINLEELGIPDPGLESHSRIVVATRSLHICQMMASDKQIEVVGLSWEESWDLFQQQAGDVVDSPNIRSRAGAVVSECDGLPLAINVIGRALAKENDVLSWRVVLSKLLSVTKSKSGDTEYHNEAVLQQLKVGYDKLHDSSLKCGFLYCVMFPEDHNIQITELIKYWIQEGLVTGNLADAHRKGYRIVRHLIEASLLEYVDGDAIKMNDMIRDLAAWIILTEEKSLDFLVGRKFNKVGNQKQMLEPKAISIADNPQKLPRVENHLLLSRAAAGLVIPPQESEWAETEMIFLMDNDISKLPEKPNCPKLKSLFLQRNRRLTTIPASFFDSMPCLQVLNLSKTYIRSLPPSIFRLNRLQVLILRHCLCLSEISPEIGKVESLEILDLCGTEIYSLPDTIGKLSQLKHLHVSFYGYIEDNKFHKEHKNLIPGGIISELQALEELCIQVQPGDTQWKTDAKFVSDELSKLSKLDTICICFPEVKFLETFLRCSTAWNADTLRKFKFVIGHDIQRSASHVPRDTELDYDQEDKCLRYVNTDVDYIPDEIKEVLKRATAFYLDHQSKLRSVTEFGIENISQLKLCIVSECKDMDSIVDGGGFADESALPNLSRLSLHYLWNLNHIWKGEITAGSFNALKVLSIHACPRLEFVLSWSMLQYFSSLEELVVEDCESMTEIIESEMEIEVGAAELPRLKRLKLHFLPRLLRICNGSHQKIEHLLIQYCPELKSN